MTAHFIAILTFFEPKLAATMDDENLNNEQVIKCFCIRISYIIISKESGYVAM